MELIGTLVYYTFGLSNLFLLLYILTIILSRANSYPFNKTDPYTESLFILCVLVHQISYFLYSYNVYLDNIAYQNLCRIITSFFDHFLCFIPLITKIKSVSRLFQFSYQHLSYEYSNDINHNQNQDKLNNDLINENNISDKKFEIYEQFYNKRAKNPNSDFKYGLINFFIIIMNSSILIFSLYYIPESHCILFYSMFGLKSSINNMECSNLNNYMKIILFVTVFKNVIYYSLLCYIIKLIFNLWKYDIKKDIFFIRLELTINCLWIICHNFIFHSYLLLTRNQTTFDTLIFNFLIDFSFTLIHLFFVRIKEKQKIKERKKKQEDYLDSNHLLGNKRGNTPEYIIIKNDFKKFMRNIVCFLALKKYVKSIPEYNYVNTFLEFYIDYYLYKIHLKKDELVKKTDLIIHAYYLYNKYFKKDDNNNNLLDVPLEIIEDIEEKSREEFCFTRKQLYVVYDNAFKTVYNKLYNIYAILMEDKKAIGELEKILEYTELDEVKEEVIEL